MQNSVNTILKENQESSKKKLLTNVNEIKAFNAEVTKLFKGSGLLLRPGAY